jgi:hypothetical protein
MWGCSDSRVLPTLILRHPLQPSIANYASPDGLPRADARLASSRWSDATGRASTRRAPTKGFSVSLHLILLPQALLGAITSTAASHCPGETPVRGGRFQRPARLGTSAQTGSSGPGRRWRIRLPRQCVARWPQPRQTVQPPSGAVSAWRRDPYRPPDFRSGALVCFRTISPG